MISRTLLEWRKLPYGSDPGSIPEWEADRIAAVAAASPLAGRNGTGVLEHGRKALRARGVVGVIAAEGCALEILPKIDVPGSKEESDAAIRRRLIQMLAVAFDIRIDVDALTALAWQSDTILEILIRTFTNKLADALRRGMPRRYIEQNDDLPNLRGSLDVVRQFTRHAVNPSRLACRFDELSPDIALNQIMKAALARLMRVSRSVHNQRQLHECYLAYADISEVSRSRLKWNAVRLDRTNRRWGELVEFARMFLSEQFQTSTIGDSSGYALLFDMGVLFEKYIGQLVRGAVESPSQVSLQGGRRPCLTRLPDPTKAETERPAFQTKPDILIRSGKKVVQIIDTKWKRISARTDDPKDGVSQADVYQMMVYAQLYKPRRLTLFYPHHGELPNGEGLQAKYRINGTDSELQIVSFDIACGKDKEKRLSRFCLIPELVRRTAFWKAFPEK